MNKIFGMLFLTTAFSLNAMAIESVSNISRPNCKAGYHSCQKGNETDCRLGYRLDFYTPNPQQPEKECCKCIKLPDQPGASAN
mgnify:CR=1 FL=1